MTERSAPRPALLPACDPAEHAAAAPVARRSETAIARAAAMLRAAGDPARLRLLELLAGGERCVTELVADTGDAMPTVSQRLARLKGEGLLVARRAGKHVHYALADAHVASLMLAVLDHADHAPPPARAAARPSPTRSPR